MVFGLDPGLASGFIVAEVEAEGRSVLEVYDWGEYPQLAVCARLEEALPTLDVVVCELWRPRGGALKFQPYSLEIIGTARWLTYKAGVEFVLQPPAVKEVYRRNVMDQFPAVGRGKAGHARDALAHVIGWASTRKLTA